MTEPTEEKPDFSRLAAAIKNFDFKAAMRSAFGKCPEHNKPVAYGRWLRWCEERGCTYIAPITKTQRLEADQKMKGQYDHLVADFEANNA